MPESKGGGIKPEVVKSKLAEACDELIHYGIDNWDETYPTLNRVVSQYSDMKAMLEDLEAMRIFGDLDDPQVKRAARRVLDHARGNGGYFYGRKEKKCQCGDCF